jgi:choline dehydrogenase-like flavoprotein
MKNFIRGYGLQGNSNRAGYGRHASDLESFGADLKAKFAEPGPWQMKFGAWGEHLPYHDNKLELDYENLDQWGQPTVRFDCEFKENERAMREDVKITTAEILEASGFKNIKTFDQPNANPGLCIHEMGTARMGRDPKTSVLNGRNQVHGVPNVFVTDGASMTSSACQNPSLTYMAMTARAANFAVDEITKGNL